MNNDVIVAITDAKLLHFYEQGHKKETVLKETASYFDVGQKVPDLEASVCLISVGIEAVAERDCLEDSIFADPVCQPAARNIPFRTCSVDVASHLLAVSCQSVGMIVVGVGNSDPLDGGGVNTLFHLELYLHADLAGQLGLDGLFPQLVSHLLALHLAVFVIILDGEVDVLEQFSTDGEHIVHTTAYACLVVCLLGSLVIASTGGQHRHGHGAAKYGCQRHQRLFHFFTV